VTEIEFQPSAMSPQSPPYVAVIFTSWRMQPGEGENQKVEQGEVKSNLSSRDSLQEDQDYDLAAQHMEALANQQPGFLGFESARAPSGFGISISYWQDVQAAQAWKNHAAHRKAQEKGREGWYRAYHVQICHVERAYGFWPKESR